MQSSGTRHQRAGPPAQSASCTARKTSPHFATATSSSPKRPHRHGRRCSPEQPPSVTDGGTLAAHASLVAREYAIPAVVGTGDAPSASTRDSSSPSTAPPEPSPHTTSPPPISPERRGCGLPHLVDRSDPASESETSATSSYSRAATRCMRSRCCPAAATYAPTSKWVSGDRRARRRGAAGEGRLTIERTHPRARSWFASAPRRLHSMQFYSAAPFRLRRARAASRIPGDPAVPARVRSATEDRRVQ